MRLNRSMFAHAYARNAAAPTAPTMPVLLPGDAKNCQLPSNNSQNKTSRHSLIPKVIDQLHIYVLLVSRPDVRLTTNGDAVAATISADLSLPRKPWSWYSIKAL